MNRGIALLFYLIIHFHCGFSQSYEELDQIVETDTLVTFNTDADPLTEEEQTSKVDHNNSKLNGYELISDTVESWKKYPEFAYIQNLDSCLLYTSPSPRD